VCHLSADHELVAAAVAAANDPTRQRGVLIPRPHPARTTSIALKGNKCLD
jgi:PqqA peptide cyclase